MFGQRVFVRALRRCDRKRLAITFAVTKGKAQTGSGEPKARVCFIGGDKFLALSRAALQVLIDRGGEAAQLFNALTCWRVRMKRQKNHQQIKNPVLWKLC